MTEQRMWKRSWEKNLSVLYALLCRDCLTFFRFTWGTGITLGHFKLCVNVSWETNIRTYTVNQRTYIRYISTLYQWWRETNCILWTETFENIKIRSTMHLSTVSFAQNLMPRKLATLNVHGRNYVECSCTTSDSDGTTENAPYLCMYLWYMPQRLDRACRPGEIES